MRKVLINDFALVKGICSGSMILSTFKILVAASRFLSLHFAAVIFGSSAMKILAQFEKETGMNEAIFSLTGYTDVNTFDKIFFVWLSNKEMSLIKSWKRINILEHQLANLQVDSKISSHFRLLKLYFVELVIQLRYSSSL